MRRREPNIDCFLDDLVARYAELIEEEDLNFVKEEYFVID